MNVATAAGLRHRRLGHESHGLALLRGNFLYSLLENDVAVRHRDWLRVNEINLVLTAPPFSLARLHWNIGSEHLVANGTEERLIARELQGVIVDSIIARGRQVAVAAGEG